MSNLPAVLTKLTVNTIGVTTTTASLLTPDEAPSLIAMTLTGEKVSNAVVDRWSEHVELRSGYGLSECTQLNWTKRLLKGSPPNLIDHPSGKHSRKHLVLIYLIDLVQILHQPSSYYRTQSKSHQSLFPESFA